MPFVARGTVLHEIMHLPLLWFRLWQQPAGKFSEQYFRYGDHPRQYLLVMRPLQPVPERRLLLFFHGGAWRVGRPELFRTYARPFLDLGFTVVFPSVRRTPRYGYFSIREDLTSLLLDLGKRGYKAEQVVIGGMSSGANLAALTLLDDGGLARAGWSPSDFSGALFLGAPLDLNAMPDSEPLLSFSGPRHSEQFRQANPASYLPDRELPPWPVLCIHGSHDGLVPLAASAKFVEQLRRTHRGRIDFQVLENGTHLDAVNWVYQENTVRQTILDWVKRV